MPMTELNKNWITEGLIDFEYKKYVLLGYLQNVESSFKEKKLYPYLSDLLFHYNNLLEIKQNKKILHENFPKLISKADFEKLQLVYEEIVNDDKIMQEIEDILSYSIPMFKEHLITGKGIYDEMEQNMSISPVGVSPLYFDNGYLLIYLQNQKETKVYEYQITIFENAEEKFRGVHTHYMETISKSLMNTFESIKFQLIKKYKKLPNPATFLVAANVDCPFNETLLPIAKRLLVKHISTT
jgi:hypothetical protein